MLPEYEYRPLRVPPGTSRSAVREILALHAAYYGWELARMHLLPDGTRRITMRRRLTRTTVPDYLPT